MCSRKQQLMTTTVAILMVVVQCVVQLPNACGCADQASSSQEATADHPLARCCSQPPACPNCKPTQCNCGDSCGAQKTDCNCGCSDHDDTPTHVPESEQRTPSDVKTPSNIDSQETVVSVLIAAHEAAKSTSRSGFAFTAEIRVLLCTWQT